MISHAILINENTSDPLVRTIHDTRRLSNEHRDSLYRTLMQKEEYIDLTNQVQIQKNEKKQFFYYMWLYKVIICLICYFFIKIQFSNPICPILMYPANLAPLCLVHLSQIEKKVISPSRTPEFVSILYALVLTESFLTPLKKIA
jgi:hypothetical protein